MRAAQRHSAPRDVTPRVAQFSQRTIIRDTSFFTGTGESPTGRSLNSEVEIAESRRDAEHRVQKSQGSADHVQRAAQVGELLSSAAPISEVESFSETLSVSLGQIESVFTKH